MFAADEFSPSWLSGLLNMGGAVVTTAFFLYYQLKREDRLEPVVKANAEAMANMKDNFLAHNKTQVDEFIRATREQSEQMRQLMGDHMDVTRENIKVVGELKAAVDVLRVELGRKQDR